MGVLLPAVAVAVGTYALWSLTALVANIQSARRSGLPVIVQPMHCMSPLYLLTMVFNRPIIERLPFGLSQWKYLHFFYMDWAYHTKAAQFEAYGNMFIIATPGGNTLCVGDADITLQVLTRRADFPKDIKFYSWVRFFGDSVLTTEGSQWRQHRKITAPPFSEAVNSSAWKATLTQAVSLLAAWTSTPAEVAVIRDIRSVARNVLSSAGFGVEIPFVSINSTTQPQKTDDNNDAHFGTVAPAGHTLPYGEALDWVLDNVLTLFLVPAWLQRLGPAAWRTTAVSYVDTGLYLSELLSKERTSGAPGAKKNLLGALVATSDGAAKHDQLSQDDLVGNVFVFAVAGLETTAGTLQYALTQLALRPDIQEWLWKDLDAVLSGESDDPADWDYAVVWPKLVVPLCIIYETLRHHPTFQSLPKWTSSAPQPLTYNNTTVIIPAATTVFITLVALHNNAQYWGPDAHSFTPQAWDMRLPSTWPSSSSSAALSSAAPWCGLRQPPVRGCYLPFSEGFRQCLGKNFALVEMAAVLAVLFRAHGCRVARRGTETQAQANERAKAAIEGSSSRLTVMMRSEVGLVWERR